ncbi:extensin [Streptomyces sp. NPDC060184]|uniref:extensin n=1 Tax=Streptomyces sp. NPDC060184 TaxID=3347064 RepID=UPI003665707F
MPTPTPTPAPTAPTALQRSVAAPATAVPLRRPGTAPARSADGGSAAAVAPLSAPAAPAGAAASPMPVVQRLWGRHSKTAGNTPGHVARPGRSAIGSLAASAAATVAGHLTHSAPPDRPAGPPPPYTPAGPLPPYSQAGPPPPVLPPEYTEVTEGAFDPKALTDFQLDELTHLLIGRITRLIRTELRLDRERIGKLRDPRR